MANDFASILPVVPSSISGQTVSTVDARALHSALGVGRFFAHWIKERLSTYGYEEGIDYISVSTPLNQKAAKNALANFGKCENSGPQRIDYFLTLDAAKEIAMVEHNARGREVRRYFIECERQLRAVRNMEKEEAAEPKPYSLTDQIRARKEVLAICLEDRNQLTLAVDKTLVALTGRSALKEAGIELIAPQQSHLYTPTEIGRQLNPPHSAIRVNKLLEAIGWQKRLEDRWEAMDAGRPYAVYIDTGKAHSGGAPIRQLKWTAGVIAKLQSLVTEEQ